MGFCVRLPHELFVGDLAVRYGDAAAFLVAGAAADNVTLLNFHHPHRGLVILLFHILSFFIYGSPTAQNLPKSFSKFYKIFFLSTYNFHVIAHIIAARSHSWIIRGNSCFLSTYNFHVINHEFFIIF